MTQPTGFRPFDPEGGLILAAHLPGSAADFGPGRLDWERLRGGDREVPLWIHLDRKKERAQRWIREEAGLGTYVAEALLAEETRPRAEAIGDGLLVILRGINMNEGAQADELIAIRMWIDAKRFISLRQFRFQTIVEIRQRVERGEAPATPGAMLAAVACGLSARIVPTLDNLREMLDSVEDQMIERDSDDDRWRSLLGTIRRQAITYRRYLIPQREALSALANGRSALLDDRDRSEIRVALEQITRECESLEELRDRAAVTQEELRARHEARVGRTVYLLTLVATVALPLGLLTGLMGINVGGMPLVNSRWGFWAVVGVMVAVAAGQVWWFKKKRWV